jgi:tetratricopeptide (TPR) repeat protein
MAMAGVMLAAAQTGQPAQASQTVQTEKKPQYRDQQEHTFYDSVTKEADANKRLALLGAWREKYPDSDFKMARALLFLDTYQKMGQYAKMIDASRDVLAINPEELGALYWIALLTPQLNLTSQDALDTGEKAANGLLAAAKPAAVKDEDWTRAKPQTDAVAYTTLGWIAMQRKNNDVAEQNFKKSLTANPNAAQVSYWLGSVILAEHKPEKQSEALFDFARAAAYDGTGALTPDGRQKMDAYLAKVYNMLHGDSSGLAELKAMAKVSPTPPADFKIKTDQEVARAPLDARGEPVDADPNDTLAQFAAIEQMVILPVVDVRADASAKVDLRAMRKYTQQILKWKRYTVMQADNTGSVGQILEKDLSEARPEWIVRVGPPEARWVMVIGLKGVYYRGSIPSAEVFGFIYDKERGRVVWKGGAAGGYQSAQSVTGVGGASAPLTDLTMLLLMPGSARQGAVSNALFNLLSAVPQLPKKKKAKKLSP